MPQRFQPQSNLNYCMSCKMINSSLKTVFFKVLFCSSFCSENLKSAAPCLILKTVWSISDGKCWLFRTINAFSSDEEHRFWSKNLKKALETSGETAGSKLEAFLPASGSQMRMQETAVAMLTFISRLDNRTIFSSVLKESEDATQIL